MGFGDRLQDADSDRQLFRTGDQLLQFQRHCDSGLDRFHTGLVTSQS